MEFRQLEHFIAVAEELSFTRAAARVNIVQSGLSMSIRALESELGAPLFLREGRTVRLSPAGEALLPEARRVLSAARGARDVIDQTRGVLRGPLGIGFAQTYESPSTLAVLLGRFHREHPEVEIRVFQGPARAGYEALRRGEIDLVVGGRAPNLPASVGQIPLRRVPFRFACAPACPLAERDSVALDEAVTLPFIDLTSEWSARRIVDRAIADAGLARSTRCEVNEVWTLLELVEQGLGVAIIPEMFGAVPMDVRHVPLDPRIPDFELIAAFLGRAPESAPARAFLAMLTHKMLGREVTSASLED
ncbi:MAG TPA: LysR family transcriptional regulator [Gemmatimonadaceae bacterium]|nr:LysR family transcriptional regulator [Gemmatimonadaceae bacterium]